MNIEFILNLKVKITKIVLFWFFIVLFIVLSLLLWYLTCYPVDLKDIKEIEIKDGYSIKQTSDVLKSNGLISSSILANVYMKYGKLTPKSGVYKFNNSGNMFSVIKRVINADYGNVYETVTFPEGLTNRQLIDRVLSSPFVVSEDELVKLTAGKEGYLFPDTYSFLPGVNADTIIRKLEETFSEKFIKSKEGMSLEMADKEIVIMASIIEKESSSSLKEKQIISGILWKRIGMGMPLQVDAPFLYERGKGSAQLSHEDLQKDSLYNTYTKLGLTPTPIGNPGYDALYAASHPIETEYLFYLHGSDGSVHYGRNYSEHLKNKRLYLK